MNKKNNIISCSIKFLKRHSFRELSFELLAKEFNVSKTAIHYYFPKKIDLGLAICDSLSEKLLQQLEDFKKNINKESIEFIYERISFLKEDEVCPIIRLQSDFNDLEHSLQNRVKELAKLEYSVYVDILSRTVTRKEAAFISQIHLSALKGAQYYNQTLSIPFNSSVMTFIEESSY